MPELLTKKRQAYVASRKPKVIRGKPLNVNAAVQHRYTRALTSIVKQMTEQTNRELLRFFKGEAAKTYFAMDASVSSEAKKVTNQLTKKFEQLFNSKAEGLAKAMVAQTEKASTSSLHGSLKELSGGLSLKTDVVTGPMKDIMTAAVAENVSLIKSIASEYLNGVQGAVMRSITNGNGLQDLVPYLEKHQGITIRRARMIAMDQTRKTYSALNEERSKKVGLDEYEWIHTGGSVHPREDHVAMSGQIFSYTDPARMARNKDGLPITPGSEINCRCRARPVIKFDEGANE